MDNQLEQDYKLICERKNGGEEGSYTAYLFNKGLEKILKKVGEEATEVVISSLGNNKEDQIGEICDLTYHMLVLMAELDISLEDVNNELKRRSAKTNNYKGERKPIEKI